MAIDSLRDFEIAFEGMNLAKIGASLTVNAVASIILAMYQAMAEKRGYSSDIISATPRKRYSQGDDRKRGLDLPVEPAVDLVGDTIEHRSRQCRR